MTLRNALIGVAIATGAALPAAARAADVANRTILVSRGDHGADAAGDSRNPVMSSTGRFMAFDSNATTLSDDGNGATRDVFLRDVDTGVTALVSRAAGGQAGNGPSSNPAISAGGNTVAFLSGAGNLVGTDENGVDDVYVRDGFTLVRASVDADGGDSDGPSSIPDISADGRYVVFASLATDLVPGDTNRTWDVFVRDIKAQTTRFVSRGLSGNSAGGSSGAPAISPDGRYVTFSSDAPDLVAGDTNRITDVFITDFERQTTQRVSVSDEERQQNAAVPAPYIPVSDVSAGGRYVVFDSDASNLVRPDRNKATDVFLRDVAGGTTRRISSDDGGKVGDQDSFFPTISPDGRYVGFQSFASNFSAFDGTREDLFVYDRALKRQTLVDVTNRSRQRGAERIGQILQRATMSDDGRYAAFSSTADDVAPGDADGTQDVYRRDLAPPRAKLTIAPLAHGAHPPYRLGADDPLARSWTCRIDKRDFPCSRKGRFPAIKAGTHRFAVRAGGPGMLWQAKPTIRRFTSR